MKKILTITKTYTNNKAAHRQWRHEGHCRFVHGENWTFHVTFACHDLDDKGFIVDFGGLRPLRAEIEAMFDHTLLIDEDDPRLADFQQQHRDGLCDLRVVKSCSAEGLCEVVLNLATIVLMKLHGGRVWVSKVVVEEDTKNVATLEIQPFEVCK